MLVLSRKTHETIRIGDDIYVTVVRIGPNTVRLGITAPAGVNIARTELLPAPGARMAPVALPIGGDA